LALTPGSRLGVYEIAVPIGEGGMGRVYRQIMAASYAVTGDTFVPGKPGLWVSTRVAPGRPNTHAWDLAPDGKRVALLTPVNLADSSKQEHVVVLLQNFFDELRRRVPLAK
jgi:hypothetical protein